MDRKNEQLLNGVEPSYSTRDRKYLKDEVKHLEAGISPTSELLPMSRYRINKMVKKIKNEQKEKVSQYQLTAYDYDEEQ